MKRQGRTVLGWRDLGIAFTLAAGYVVLLLRSVRDLGYARDEGFYFQASQAYANWFSLLAKSPGAALERKAVDAA